MVPVFIKGMGNIFHRRANQHHIHIRELIVVTDIVILIGHVAPTNQSHLMICNKTLVVHTSIDTFQVQHHVERTIFPKTIGIKQLDLNIGVLRQCQKNAFGGFGIVVINQQANPDPTVCGTNQRVQGQCANFVVVPDVIL